MKWRNHWALSVGLSPLAATRRHSPPEAWLGRDGWTASAPPPEQRSVGARKATVAVGDHTNDRRPHE